MKIKKITSWGMPANFINILNDAAGEDLFTEEDPPETEEEKPDKPGAAGGISQGNVKKSNYLRYN